MYIHMGNLCTCMSTSIRKLDAVFVFSETELPS